MEIRHFRLISTVSRVGTLSKASEILCLSQSALSHQLKELETNTGVIIFHRINKKLVLSETGKIFLKYSDVILNHINDLTQILTDIKGEKTGNIKISLEAYTSYFWMPPILKEFNRLFPNVEINIKTDDLTKPLQLLQNRKLDYAITVSKEPNEKFDFYPLIDDQIVVLMALNNRLSYKDFVDIGDLQNEVVITHGKKDERNKILEDAYRDKPLPSTKFIHITNTQSILEMVSENLGVAFLSKWAIEQYVDTRTCKLMRLSERGTFRKWYLAKLTSKQESDYEKQFISILKKNFNAES